MHAATVIAEEWLWHKSNGLAVLVRHIAHYIFVEDHVVRRFDQSVEFLVNFALPATCDFMMMTFDIQPALDHRGDHFASEILIVIGGGNWEISFFVPGTISKIIVLATRVPASLFRVYVVKTAVLVLIKANVVEDKKLGFCPKICSVGKTAVR